MVKYFPLAFVYGLTTWAVWVEATVGLKYTKNPLLGKPLATLGIIFYLLLNASYTVAVCVDPGSPLESTAAAAGGSSSNRRRRYGWRRGGGGGSRDRHEYSGLPTTEQQPYPEPPTSLTVSSSGGARFCKKCQGPKPDRTHHCSTCNRCVLKMDHHCPWLAACVGLHNYKPFLLFLIYTCLFCCVCMVISARWIWNEMLTDVNVTERMLPVNAIMLAVISLVIGLVLTGFTGWHVSLAVRGVTTIECLENTRYLSPVRKTLDRQRLGQHQPGPGPGPGGRASASASPRGGPQNEAGGGIRQTMQDYEQRFWDAHANAIPGVTRAEEGEERPSPSPEDQLGHLAPSPGRYDPNEHLESYNTPAQQSLYHSYEELERARANDRYEEYLDERDSEKLPNAFDLGWRRNLDHLFGPSPYFWLLPVCNTTGDGWHWDANPRWIDAKQRIDRQRIDRWEQDQRYQWDLQNQQHQHQHQQQQQHEHPSYDGGGGGGGGGGTPVHSNSRRAPSNARNVITRGRSHHHDRGDAPADDERPLTGVSMQTLAPMSPRPRPEETDSDEEEFDVADGGSPRPRPRPRPVGRDDEWRDWE